MAQPTAQEWNAKTEALRGQIAEQKYRQTERELKRETRRMRLQDISDRSLEVDINRAETGLKKSELALKGDQIQLQGEKDKVRYLAAKQTLQQHLWASELSSMQVSLAASDAKLAELRNVAKTLNHRIQNHVPANLFTATTPND
jgi:hypothetical protein